MAAESKSNWSPRTRIRFRSPATLAPERLEIQFVSINVRKNCNPQIVQCLPNRVDGHLHRDAMTQAFYQRRMATLPAISPRVATDAKPMATEPR